jgi:hypothetical protein
MITMKRFIVFSVISITWLCLEQGVATSVKVQPLAPTLAQESDAIVVGRLIPLSSKALWPDTSSSLRKNGYEYSGTIVIDTVLWAKVSVPEKIILRWEVWETIGCNESLDWRWLKDREAVWMLRQLNRYAFDAGWGCVRPLDDSLSVHRLHAELAQADSSLAAAHAAFEFVEARVRAKQ